MPMACHADVLDPNRQPRAYCRAMRFVVGRRALYFPGAAVKVALISQELGQLSVPNVPSGRPLAAFVLLPRS